jgi:O-antigen/teichoic acid export membrane protein
LSLKRQLIKSFMGVGAMRFMAIPIGLATTVLLARLLGPEQFGQYAFIMAVVPLLALPITGGMQTLLTREIASYSQAGNWALYKGALNAAHGWAIGGSISIAIAYATFAYGLAVIPTSGKWALMPIALLMLPFLGLNAARNGVIKGLGMPVAAELPGTLIQPLMVLGALSGFAFFIGLNIYVAIWMYIASVAAAFLIATMIFFRVRPTEALSVQAEYDFRTWRSALAPFILLSLIGTFNAQLGILALGLFSSDDQVAALRVAERAAQFVSLSLVMVNLVISPHIVKAFKSNDIRLLQQLSRLTARGALAVALPIGLLMIIFGDWLIKILFGQEYSELSYLPLVILVIGQIFNVFFGSVGFLLAMTGNEKQSFKGQVFAVLVSIILCWALIPTMGAVGGAVAVSSSIIVWNVILGYLVYRKVGIRPSAL